MNIVAAFRNSHPREVSPTFHHPVFQSIGGAVFFIPPMVMAPVSRYLTSIFPMWPVRFQSLTAHRSIWERFVAWLLGFWTCLLVYKVARIYYSARAAGTAIALCALGGPILTFVARWPVQTNLPTAFLSALLLYVYHFAVRRKCLSWLLLGAVWGFGVLVRNEFAVWALLPVYGIIQEIRSGVHRREIILHVLSLVVSAGSFLAVVAAIQLILYGSWGNTYGILVDPRLLAELPRMLFGPRNGFFSFWPIFLLALIGYLVKFRSNPGINHLLFAVFAVGAAVCTVFPFWLAPGGQRPLLMVVPCFMLFLARLLDGRDKLFWPLVLIGVACVFWAVLVFIVYGNGWELADGSVGFLKANTLPEMFGFLSGKAGAFFPAVIRFIFLPKQRVLWPILLVLLPVFLLIVVLQKSIPRRKALPLLFAVLGIFCLGALIFLAGAGKRGREYFRAVAPAQPDGWLVYNSRYHIGEYFFVCLHYVAYFLEYDRPDTAKHFEEKAVEFLQKAAPALVEEFRQTCQVLRVRRSLGWKQVLPAGQEEDPRLWLLWYCEKEGEPPPFQWTPSFFSESREDKEQGLAAPRINVAFESDFQEIVNNYRIPGALLQR